MKKISVLGLGYMGLPTASLLATHGFKVVGVDVNADKVAAIQNRQIPFDEPGLKELVIEALDSNNLTVSTKLSASDVFLIAVPTPVTEEKKADLSYVVSAARMIVPFLKKGNLVVLESTVPPATCTNVLVPILEESGLKAGEDFHVSHCPERAIPGNTLHELINNDRIIGGIDQQSTNLTKELYTGFVKGNIFLTEITTAETVKLMENTFRDINIALANEFAVIGEEVGINIWEAIQLANRHPRVNILYPGPGVGGHCIAVDPWFLTEQIDNCLIITTARAINDNMPGHVVRLIRDVLPPVDNPKIAILGVAYKANVDDARETPAISIIEQAKQEGWQVAAHDHLVKKSGVKELADLEEALQDADCVVLVTNHNEFRELDPAAIKKLMRTPILVDTRNFLDHDLWRKAGFKVRILGNGQV